jgi:diaminopimelate decarboxylase
MTWPRPRNDLLEHADGGPAYVYELDEVRAAYRDLRRALPEPSDLYYSLKANPHPAPAGELRRLGCRAEVSSAGELRSALEAGFGAGECLYTGPAKQPAEVAYAIELGVRLFSLDSPAQLALVSQQAEKAGVGVGALLRVNPDRPVGATGLAMTGEPSQFGADASWVLSEPDAFTSTPWCDVRGLHLFAATNVADPDTLLGIFEASAALCAALADRLGRTPEIIDLGGGFGHPFGKAGDRPDYSGLRDELTRILDDRLPGWRDGTPAIAFESGRYLVGAAGTLLCTVRDVKESKGRTFVLLDSGINHLGGMAGLRRVPRIAPSLQAPAGALPDPQPDTQPDTQPDGEDPGCDIVGPLCTPLDSWARGVRLGWRPEPGQVVAVPNVGAYGLTGSLIGFLGHDTPPEIVTEDGRLLEVSRMRLTRERDLRKEY